jgi:exonuclease VII large subunit
VLSDPVLSDDVVWLFDPAVDDELNGPVSCAPVELFGLLADALADAGLVEVAVTGTVSGLRRRHRWCGFDILELADGGDAPAATVKCVVFARDLAAIDVELAAAGTELMNGAVATVSGSLRWDPAWGEVRIVATDVVIEDERSTVAEARDRLVGRLVASGQAAAQAGLAMVERPLRVGVLAGAGTAGAADLETLFAGSGLEWRLSWRSVPMAGPRAAEVVAAGVGALAEQRPDVIVVARGGGAAGEMA